MTIGLLAIYGQTSSFEFVNWDDDAYIYKNPQILKGLTAENVAIAFTSGQNHLWHPIATLTHLADVEVYGTNAGGFHITNVLIHIAASLLLFFAIQHMTGSLYPSAFAAGLFALHPLRVESVAWVTERKDVLTGLFLAILMLAYSYYVRKPSFIRYGLVALAFLLGSMSKPTFVPVPFALLLLDYWPLRRDQRAQGQRAEGVRAPLAIWGRLFLEKIPLLIVSGMTSIITIQVQASTAIVSLEQLPLTERLVNAGRSYGIYLAQFFWPTHLAAFYSLERNTAAFWQGIAGWCVVFTLSAIVLGYATKYRYLAMGWFWYLGMLLPTIGLLQAGSQSHADRFTYLPQVGFAIAVTWALADAARHWQVPRRQLIVGALAVLVVFSVASWHQTRHWRNGVTLFTRAIDAGVVSEVVYNNLGIAFEGQQRFDEATEMYRRAVEQNSGYLAAIINYGDSLRMAGKYEQSLPWLERAYQLDPSDKDIANNIATSLIQLGRYDEAILRLEENQKKHPAFADTWINLGLARFRNGKVDDAIADYQAALRIEPKSPSAYSNLAIAFAQQERRLEAIEAFRESLKLRPQDVDTLMSAAWVVATAPEASTATVQEGLEWAKQGIGLTDGRNPIFWMMLAASYAANQQFDQAILVADRVEQLAKEQGNSGIADAVRAHRELYKQRQPVR
jgi:tetratricopeptide (TPR) repeat protein